MPSSRPAADPRGLTFPMTSLMPHRLRMKGTAMKAAYFVVCFVVVATLAQAEDMAQMISQYRQEHGLPAAVKTDAQLTAVAERQANAMAASGNPGSQPGRVFRLSHIRRASRHGGGKHRGRPRRLTMPTCCNPTPTALG
jgi:uncharacterized protein YkwD